MEISGGRQWLEVNYGDLPAFLAKKLLMQIGYSHNYLCRLHVSDLMKLVQEKIGNLIPSNGMNKIYNGDGEIYLTQHDLEKIGDKIKLTKKVADGWWSLPTECRF